MKPPYVEWWQHRIVGVMGEPWTVTVELGKRNSDSMLLGGCVLVGISSLF